MYTEKNDFQINHITKPLRNQVYKFLKSAIINGDITPGLKLIESQLAKKMGISRTPIREALHRLEQDKLIVRCPSRGFKTNEFSNDKIDEIFGIRAVLEGYAGNLALNYISKAELNNLENNIQKTEYYYENWDSKKLFRLNTLFHDVIINCSHSEILQHLFIRL